MKTIIISIAVLLLLGGGVYLFNTTNNNEPQSNNLMAPPEGPITIAGEVVCLPKVGDGPQTMECAIGLRGQDGLNYGLRNLSEFDPNYELMSIGTGVEISGVLSHEEIFGPDGNRYDVAGVIEVSAVSRTEGVAEAPRVFTGQIGCLPKAGSGPHTDECAIGLLTEGNVNYGLRNLNFDGEAARFTTPGITVSVTGRLLTEGMMGPDGNRYVIAGVIEVESIEETVR